MTKEELEKEAEKFVSEKSDKGNFDIEQFGKAYFSENSMKQALVKFTEQRKVRTEIEINGVRFSSISDMLQYMDKQRDHIINLEKENAELLCQKNRNKSCYSCANATERCFRNEIGCPCQKYKSYKEENADLEKAYNETEELLDKQIEATYKLFEENKELKDYGSEGLQAYLKLEKQLNEAKEIIERLIKATYGEGWNYSLQVKVEAEKFLKESE